MYAAHTVCRLGVAPGQVLAVLAVLWALGIGFFVRSCADLLAPLPPGDSHWTLRLVLTWGGICGLAMAGYGALTLSLGDVAHALGEWGPDPVVLRRLASALRLCAGGTGGVLVLRGLLGVWGRVLQRAATPGPARLGNVTTALVLGAMGPFSGGGTLVAIYAWRRWGGADLVALAVGGLLIAACWHGFAGPELCLWWRRAPVVQDLLPSGVF